MRVLYLNCKKHFLLILFMMLLMNGCKTKELSYDEWKKDYGNHEYNWGIRKEMAQKLIEEKALIGFERTDVIQLLGEDEQYSNTPNKLYYLIDIDYDFDIDPVMIEHFIVTFDSDDIVVNASREIIKN